jgi:Protein of unknown function (DUF2589).
MTPYGNNNPNQHCTLSDIIRGVLYSVNCSQEILEHHYDNMLKKYFNREGKPITTKFMVDSERCIEVPLITLFNPAALALKELNLEMSLHIDEVSLKKIENCNFEDDASRASFNISIVPSTANECVKRPSDMVDVCMTFTAIDPPEGFSRLLDEYIKKL